MICISKSIELLIVQGVKVFNIHNTHMLKAFYGWEYFKQGLGGRKSCFRKVVFFLHSVKMEKVLKPISDVSHSTTSSMLSF